MFLFILYLILSPILWSLARLFLLFFHKKGRERILLEFPVLRKALFSLRKEAGDRERIVFHAASGGEFEQLKPLLPKVNREKYYIVQTFYSATIFRKEKNSELFDVCLYHPLDSVVSALLFFLNFKPSVYIVNRHDVWPVTLWVARLFKVKTVLINGNVHERSGRNFFLFKAFNRFSFSLFDEVYTGSTRLEKNIKTLAPKLSPIVTGDTRFEQVAQRAEKNKYDHFSSNIKDRENIVLGSIIPTDYDVVFGGIRASWGKAGGVSKGQRVLAVPHEVASKDVGQLIDALKKYDLSYTLYTDENPKYDADVFIVNTVGMLAELYGYGEVAYVGAGFGAGVHSVIEPAVYGIPVAYGPNVSLLDEAVVMAEKNIGTIIESASDFSTFLQMESSQKEAIGVKAKAFCKAALNASNTIISKLELA